jgi:hypothetical protein
MSGLKLPTRLIGGRPTSKSTWNWLLRPEVMRERTLMTAPTAPSE